MIHLPSTTTPIEFGRWMARLREDAGYGTTQEAADRLGISRQQLHRWETGASRPKPENVASISDAYSVDANEVMKRAGYPLNEIGGLSPWAESLARRIERRTAGLPAARRNAVERAIDSLLVASAS